MLKDKIIIFRHGLLGDLIVAIPALHKLRECYPTSEIILFLEIQPNNMHLIASKLLLEMKLINSIQEYTSKNISGIINLSKNILRIKNEVKFAINLERYGWSRRRELLCLALGISRVYGPSDIKCKSEFNLVNIATQLYGLSLVACELNIEESKAADLKYPTFQLSNINASLLKLEPLKLTNGPYVGYILLGIWSNMELKRWPIKRFVDVAKYVSSKYNLLPVCVGGDNSEEIASALQITSNSEAVSVVGRMTVIQSYELFKKAKFYVGNDTGAMHLAAAAGLPCVAIFSARESSSLWYPIGSSNHQILKKSPSCAGCQLRVCKMPESRCIDEITSQEVFEAIDKVFMGCN